MKTIMWKVPDDLMKIILNDYGASPYNVVKDKIERLKACETIVEEVSDKKG